MVRRGRKLARWFDRGWWDVALITGGLLVGGCAVLAGVLELGAIASIPPRDRVIVRASGVVRAAAPTPVVTPR